MDRRRRGLAVAVVLAASVVWLPASGAVQNKALPESLSDKEYWALVDELSEPGGYFQSENLVGNERALQHVVPALRAMPRQGVYLGVAPDQNFTYIVALEPRLAFIVDIRRGNLLEHLMYKAIIELSASRAESLSRLFSRARPDGLDDRTPVVALVDAYRPAVPSEELYAANLQQILAHLIETHGFDLSEADVGGLTTIYRMFFEHGPSLTYSMGGFAMRNMPEYADMLTSTDLNGERHSYLATETNYQWLRAFQTRNLLVPVVGDFAGPKALRAIGAYLSARGAVVSAFYTSNVEQYLFRNAVAELFYANLGALPIDERSVIIRSALQRNVMDPIRDLLQQVEAGRITVYSDVTSRGAVR
ncbi:MAG: hypothetical protein IT184_11240 [Acidobacteria bacterium]|nr:hypothetical protein [Acidobacteriota bacterium]